MPDRRILTGCCPPLEHYEHIRRVSTGRRMQCKECDSSREKQHCPTPHTMTLFVDDTGCPLRFFIRPGSAKRRFLPVVEQGGGVMCCIQEPGAISLADPKEQSGVAAPGYFSVQYILDCVEKNERLDLEGYRLGSTQQERADSTSSGLCWTGRVGYSREEDDAILRYLKEHSSMESLVRGNKIWQEMERAAVTCHTWQSMKDRYRKHLAGRMEAFQVEDLAATPSNAATHSTKKKSNLEETEAMDTSSDQQVIGPTCASVENQAVEQEEMKEPTNRAEKEEEVLEIRQGQEVTVESAQLTQSSSGILELAIREFQVVLAKRERKVRRRKQRGHTDLEWEEPERPAPEWEEPERPQPKMGESVRPQPKRGESVRPQPKRGESVRPQPKRGESVRPQPKRGESVRPQPKRGESVRPRPKRGKSVLPQPKRGKSVRPQPKRGESVRQQPKRGESVHPQPRYPPAEGEYLLAPPPPPWEDCVSLPPPPAEGEYLLVPPPPSWEDDLPLPPPPAEGEYLLVPPPSPWEDYLPLPAPPAEEECLLVPPPPEREEHKLPLFSRQDGPGQDAGGPQPPLHRLLSIARGKTTGSQQLRRGPTPAPLLVLAPLLQSPPEGPLPPSPSPPEGPLPPSPSEGPLPPSPPEGPLPPSASERPLLP
ncbi:UNVERIFIED_CONTAM: hypothetical protein FKN15_043889 [Acipenser sinensis]